MTKAETVTLLQTITVMYPGTKVRADELTIGVWHEMLGDLPGDVVAAAVKRMCATLKFPPSIADIREAVVKATKDAQGALTAAEAWTRVNKAVRWYGYYREAEAREKLGAEIWRAVEAVGGWREVCASEEPGIISAQFERRYNAIMARSDEQLLIPQDVREDMHRLFEPLADRLKLAEGWE